MDGLTAFLVQQWAVYGSLVNFIGVNALMGLSLYVTFSAGQLSLGNAAFAGIGGYVAGVLSLVYKWPYPASLAAGAAVAGLVGAALGLPVLRLKGVFLAIATLGFGEVVRIVALNLEITGGAGGLLGIPVKTTTLIIYAALAACCWLLARLRTSRMGWALAAIREDEAAARAMGVDATLYKTAAFSLGAAMAGLAGGLYAHLNFMIAPGEFGFNAAVNLLMYNIIGGTRGQHGWIGPILGAALLTALPEILRASGMAAGPMRMGVSGVILLLVILFLPGGLASLPSVLGKRRQP